MVPDESVEVLPHEIARIEEYDESAHEEGKVYVSTFLDDFYLKFDGLEEAEDFVEHFKKLILDSKDYIHGVYKIV